MISPLSTISTCAAIIINRRERGREMVCFFSWERGKCNGGFKVNTVIECDVEKQQGLGNKESPFPTFVSYINYCFTLFPKMDYQTTFS